MYTRILIATDGSEVAQRAVSQGIELAASLDSKVTFVVVSETITGNILAGQPEIGLFTGTHEIEAASEKAAVNILADARKLAEARGLACEIVHHRNMVPSDGILSTAESMQADLIVMGSHGWGAVARFFLGSQAVNVVSRSSVPVLITK